MASFIQSQNADRLVCTPLLQTPDGFNEWKTDEDIISFHLTALRQQLEQIYIGLAMAVALQRIFILPKVSAIPCVCISSLAGWQLPLERIQNCLIFQCYNLQIICFCDKSWYAMYRCRLDDADEMRLPFACPGM